MRDLTYIIIQTEKQKQKKIKRKRTREGGKEESNKQENSKANREHINYKREIPKALAGATMEAKNNQTDGEFMIRL